MFSFSLVVIILSFWQLLVVILNFITQPILKNSSKNHSNKVSILIPARNEEKNILNLLESIKKQQYENLEVIVLDDNSEDHTYSLVKNFANENEQFKIIRGEQLANGWLGKNWACQQLAKEAKGEYLLFLDADTTIEANLINSTLAYMNKKNLKLLSLFPDQITESLGEKIVVPFINYVLVTLLPLIFVRFPYFSSLSAANGQFMLFEAKNYQENSWHEKVKNNVAEDVTIVRKMKKSKYKIAVLLANGFIKCRMYNNLAECILGFEKNILLIFGNSTLFLTLYIILSLFNIIFATSIQEFAILLGIVLLARVFSSKLSKQSILYNLILYPLQIILVTWIALRAIYKKLSKNEVSWKGRKILVEKI